MLPPLLCDRESGHVGPVDAPYGDAGVHPSMARRAVIPLSTKRASYPERERNAVVASAPGWQSSTACSRHRWSTRRLDSMRGVRFNEAIDHMLAESVRQYAQRTERIRDLFAGVLAHDLRSPPGAILNSAEVVLHDDGLASSSIRAVAIAQRGAVRMKQMIDDLLVFTRTPPRRYASSRFHCAGYRADLQRRCG